VRSNPTGRQLRFGAELRKLRERAGLTATGAGQLMGIKQTQVSNMEAGRVGVSAERVRALACHYDCLLGAFARTAGAQGRRIRPYDTSPPPALRKRDMNQP
jgi:transcriptional regulator with XRE-family HTH domain